MIHRSCLSVFVILLVVSCAASTQQPPIVPADKPGSPIISSLPSHVTIGLAPAKFAVVVSQTALVEPGPEAKLTSLIRKAVLLDVEKLPLETIRIEDAFDGPSYLGEDGVRMTSKSELKAGRYALRMIVDRSLDPRMSSFVQVEPGVFDLPFRVGSDVCLSSMAVCDNENSTFDISFRFSGQIEQFPAAALATSLGVSIDGQRVVCFASGGGETVGGNSIDLTCAGQSASREVSVKLDKIRTFAGDPLSTCVAELAASGVRLAAVSDSCRQLP